MSELARFFDPTKPRGRTWPSGGGDEQTVGKRVEMKSPIEAVSEGGQVA